MGTRQVFRFSDKFRGDISNSFAWIPLILAKLKDELIIKRVLNDLFRVAQQKYALEICKEILFQQQKLPRKEINEIVSIAFGVC